MSDFRKQHMAIQWNDIVSSDSYEPAINASLQEKASLVGRVGLMMLSVGTGAWRVRASMNKIARSLNIVCNADIGLLSIEYTCTENGQTYTNALSLSTTGINTDKLNELEHFADGFHDRVSKYSITQFHRILDKFDEMPHNYKAYNLALASALACCGFTFLLGGGAVEMILAFFGAGVGQFVRKKFIERKITLLANVTAGVAAACCTYALLFKLAVMLFGIAESHQAGYICSMLFVIPGFPVVTGVIDISKLDMRSGLERLAYAILIIVMATLTGWTTSMILDFHPQDFEELQLDPLVKCIIRIITSFCGVYGFSFLYNSKRKMAVTAGLIGMTANTLRLELIDFTGMPPATAAFIGALTAGLLASAIKKYIGYPRISITVPSIVIMVPGMFMYKAVYYMGLNDIDSFEMWFTKAILITISIPLGLIFARILTDKNFRKSS